MWSPLLFAGTFPGIVLALANRYHLLCVSSLGSQSHHSSAGELTVGATSLVKRSQREFVNLKRGEKNPLLFLKAFLKCLGFFFCFWILDYKNGLCCAAIAVLYPGSLKQDAEDRLFHSSFHWTTKSHTFLLVSALWTQECMDAFCIAIQLQQKRRRNHLPPKRWLGHSLGRQLYLLEQFSKQQFFEELNSQNFMLLIYVDGSKMQLR